MRDTGLSRRRDTPVVLALRALGLGDLLTTVPALRGLRRAYPDHSLVLATSGWLRPLVERMDFVDDMLEVDELGPIPVQLEADDVAVNLHGRGPESTRLIIDTEPARLVAFFHPDVPATYGAPRWNRREHETRRWCRLLREHDIDADPTDLRLAPLDDRQRALDLVVVHPGASAPERIWPADRWSSVVRILVRRGKDVVITGTRPEFDLASQVATGAGLGPCAVLAGQLDVADMADLVSHAGLLLSTDTGPAHLASAFATPSVVIFGPASPAEWGPPATGPHMVLWRGRRTRSGRPQERVDTTTVHDVVTAVQELENRRQVGAPTVSGSR